MCMASCPFICRHERPRYPFTKRSHFDSPKRLAKINKNCRKVVRNCVVIFSRTLLFGCFVKHVFFRFFFPLQVTPRTFLSRNRLVTLLPRNAFCFHTQRASCVNLTVSSVFFPLEPPRQCFVLFSGPRQQDERAPPGPPVGEGPSGVAGLRML